MKSKLIITLVMILALSGLITACSTQTTPAADTSNGGESSTSIDAKTLVDTKCTACHTLDRLSSEKLDESGWVKVVGQMDKKGNIGFTADEKAAIAAYLAETYK